MSIESGCPMSRRRLFGAAGATAAGALLSPPARAKAARPPEELVHTVVRADRFGRLFDLKPFADPTAKVIAALKALGAPGGPMDVGDDLASGPLNLIVNPGRNRDHPAHSAGMTFVGQFIDHDLTLDATSPLATPTRPEATINRRTPAFDLDSVYGSGPFGDPLLYEPDRMRLRVGRRGAHEDVPRLPDGSALIGDSRNDENVAVNGLHAAFLAFHNKVLENGAAADFREARRLVTWHYQWLVLNEFLPATIGGRQAGELVAGGTRRLWRGIGEPFIPVEFQGAAYRFGHSQVRPSYRMNFTGAADGGQRFAFVFDPSQIGAPDASDMQGGYAGPGRHIGWPTFFRFDDERAQWVRPNKLIDTHLSTPLFHLPPKTVRGPEDILSLAQRNLLRHLTWSLPSGQSIARALGLPVLSSDELAELAPIHAPFTRSTPLWYYVLKEAELNGGTRLGPLGSLLVGGVIAGLMLADPNAYLNAAPGWRPTLGKRAGQFTATDLLDYAGVGAVR